MVEPQEATPANSSFDAPVAAGGKSPDDQQIATRLTEMLQKYSPASHMGATDVLYGRYKIHIDAPIPYLNTKTAKAYEATDLMDSSKQIYALVCDWGVIQRHHAIELLTGIEHPHMLTLHASGVVELSPANHERLVLFYSRPAGKKLSDLLMETKGTLNANFINKNILSPIISAVGQLSELGITHGGIRPDNIFYGEYPVLGDCLTEPCGFSQPFYYETVDRIQTLPMCKGESSMEPDYYALAVLTVYLLYGQAHFADYTPETLVKRILREGAYSALVRNKVVPEMFSDFLRGVLSGSINERWSHRNLKQWIEGKRSNIMLPAMPMESATPLEFAGTEIYGKRELAHELFLHWPLSIELMRSEQLIHWVSMGLRNKDLAETMKRARQVIIQTSAKNEIQVSEQIMLMLMTLDPHGPIRINNLSFHLDGIDALWAELMRNKAQTELRLLSKFIEHMMFGRWLDLQRTHLEYVMPASLNSISLRLDRTRLFIRNNGYGFGLERVLYELNPDMPCQSPLFTNDYVSTLPALLTKLDELAPRMKDQEPIDLHIAAFIANRLGILHDIRLHELTPNPNLATHRGILALHLISTAQARSPGDIVLPGLAYWLALRVLPALDTIRSRTLRMRVKTMLLERAKTGYTQYMADLIIHSNYASADLSGFKRAKRLYQSNIQKIKLFQTDEEIDAQSTKLGYGIARFFSYCLFLLIAYKVWG